MAAAVRFIGESAARFGRQPDSRTDAAGWNRASLRAARVPELVGQDSDDGFVPMHVLPRQPMFFDRESAGFRSGSGVGSGRVRERASRGGTSRGRRHRKEATKEVVGAETKSAPSGLFSRSGFRRAVGLDQLSWMPMPCPVCKALRREHTQECEVEAKAILEQSSQTSGDATKETVIRSRKRQVEITSKIQRHMHEVHAA